ncbi:MAG: hypothetical protein K8U57_18455 [Planctomycetes bacterium]|nr:hypothetical protein [Planctomycetota bacterium]
MAGIPPEHAPRTNLTSRRNAADFRERMSGTGVIANQIGAMVAVFASGYGLDGGLLAYDCSRFHAPAGLGI